MCLSELPVWEQHAALLVIFIVNHYVAVGFALLWAAWLKAEQWLGRTTKTKAASTLDLVRNGVLKLFGKSEHTAAVVKQGEPLSGEKIP